MTENNKKNKLIDDIKNLTFEQALSELEKIVSTLERGEGSLENAIEQYEYGNALREYCEKKLKEAKLKIDKVIKNEDGITIINETE